MYEDRLPRKFSDKETAYCNALTDKGARCPKPAQYEVSFHGDNGIYFNDPCQWVRVCFCEKHLPSVEKLILKQRADIKKKKRTTKKPA